MGEFRMPALGADMESGTVLEWRVQPGDRVHRGDIVAVVDTDKSDIEVEVFEDGVIEQIVVAPGVEVPVGEILALISGGGGHGAAVGPRATAGSTPASPPPSRPSRRPGKRSAPVQRVPTPGARAFVRASPLARRRAADRQVDLGQVAGSGPGGAVVVADVDHAPLDVATAGAREDRDRQSRLRHSIGELMARSQREVPHYYLATTIDLSASMRWLADTNLERPVSERLLPAAVLLKTTAIAANQVPVVNGFFDGEFRPSASVHLGVAVSLRRGGLVAPAIRDADRRTVVEVMAALRDLVNRARAGILRSSEMADPTITVTNLGDQGVEEVFGVIYPPQVALVGFGRIVERPWASSGMLGVRPVVRATLSGDHRVSDGHDGARFLSLVDELLQSPEAL
jgi:pyruvate dehydrogenase E2 component (dihydrolipoamide acetyltransferase)